MFIAGSNGRFGLGYGVAIFNAAGASLDGLLGEDHDPETHLIPIVLQALGQRERFLFLEVITTRMEPVYVIMCTSWIWQMPMKGHFNDYLQAIVLK